MTDVSAYGKTFTFSEKANQYKDSVYIKPDGSETSDPAQAEGAVGFKVRFVFRNGETREQRYDLGHPLFTVFAAHGADQKYGDYNAGIKDVEDIVANWDELNERLVGGDWGATRESTGLSGVSTLVKALVMVTRKPDGTAFTVDEVKANLKATRAQENGHKAIAWLRSQPKVAAAIATIEAEKAAKAAEKGKGPSLDVSAVANAFGVV